MHRPFGRCPAAGAEKEEWRRAKEQGRGDARHVGVSGFVEKEERPGI